MPEVVERSRYRVMDSACVSETNFPFRRMNVEISQVRRYFDENSAHRMSAVWKSALHPVFQRLLKGIILYAPAVCKQELKPPIGSGNFATTYNNVNAKALAACLYLMEELRLVLIDDEPRKTVFIRGN
jgi:hypothetical protein